MLIRNVRIYYDFILLFASMPHASLKIAIDWIVAVNWLTLFSISLAEAGARTAVIVVDTKFISKSAYDTVNGSSSERVSECVAQLNRRKLRFTIYYFYYE